MTNLTGVGKAAEMLEEERKKEGERFYLHRRISKRKDQNIKSTSKNTVHH